MDRRELRAVNSWMNGLVFEQRQETPSSDLAVKVNRVDRVNRVIGMKGLLLWFTQGLRNKKRRVKTCRVKWLLARVSVAKPRIPLRPIRVPYGVRELHITHHESKSIHVGYVLLKSLSSTGEDDGTDLFTEGLRSNPASPTSAVKELHLSMLP